MPIQTWADVQAAIPFRLNRPTLPTDFVLEMLYERIGYFGPLCFQPSEVTNTDIVTAPGVQFYALPSGTQKVTFVRVLYNGVWIPVSMPNSYNEILEADVLQPPFTSLPVTMCRVYGTQIRLFPTPDGQYPVELTLMQTPPAPTQDTDETNVWVADSLMRALLINATCAEICREYLDISVPNSPRIAAYDANTADLLDKVQTQAHALGGPSFLKQYI